MRKNFGVKAVVYPEPVLMLAAYDKEGKPCAMAAAWGGISEETEISVCVSEFHKTLKNILETGAFTVSPATADYVAQCDYLGLVSGNNVSDKLAAVGFTTLKSEFVDAPLIEQLPMALECRLISYDEEHCRLVGEIVNVSAEDYVLNEKGKVDVAKLRPICYDGMNHEYHVVGEKVGDAFSAGRKYR